jgi:cell division protein FtsZ
MTLNEINRAADIISQAADPDANIIFGAVIDESLGNEVRITVIATGFESHYRPSMPFKSNGENGSSDSLLTRRPGQSGNHAPDLPRALRELREETSASNEPTPPLPDWLRQRDRPEES